MKHTLAIVLLTLYTLSLCSFPAFGQSLDDIILDIYNGASELAEVDYEQLQSDLYALHDAPIDLNHTSDEELAQLYFLSPQQIDDILLYADKHPFQSLYELRMIQSLADYEIRDLLPFVVITEPHNNAITELYPKEVFAHARHEFIARVDARNIEGVEGTDPVYVQARYRFDYQRRVTFGAQLRRPAGGQAQDMQYGAYIRLRDIVPHLHTVVGGNFQASFGQGLVLAPVFHAGKSMYITSVGQQQQGLWHYSSVDGEGLHGLGTTLRWEWDKQTRLDVTALYSMSRYQDTTWRHVVGANMTFRHKRMELQLTGVESIFTDSIHPYRNTNYNRHYFRGTNQAVLGTSARYNHGWFDLFAELATAQNSTPSSEGVDGERLPRWGFGTIVGSRFYPADGVSLVALYRYYSPFFDNALGYAFSETSRLGDENGGYLGFDIARLSRWRFSGYADVFYFSGPKYGLPEGKTLGYDALFELRYSQYNVFTTSLNSDTWWLAVRARAHKKGDSTYSLRALFDWSSGPLSLRSVAEGNITRSPTNYGFTVYQDFAYSFFFGGEPGRGLSLRLRLQGFDAREWANRIYAYEHDVLYAFSIPAVYGLGGRAYLCLNWQIIPRLALYLKLSETLYAQQWAADHDRPSTRTDIHLLLRAKL